MILVRVGDHQPAELVPPLGDIGRIGHHHLDLRQLAAAEPDAAVNRQEALAARPVIAVQVQVHADFARPAKRQEGQFAGF
jgi:hypothetical protein